MMEGVENLQLRQDENGVTISVKVVPGSSRDKVVGILGECLKIATSAAPEKGKANAAIVKTLAKTLGVDRRDVEIVAGTTSQRKEVRIRGISAEGLLEALRRSQS